MESTWHEEGVGTLSRGSMRNSSDCAKRRGNTCGRYHGGRLRKESVCTRREYRALQPGGSRGLWNGEVPELRISRRHQMASVR